MKVPIRDEHLKPCPICDALNAHLDQALTDLGDATTDSAVQHVLGQITRWVVIQTLAHFDGDVAQVVHALTICLNEPQNERLIHGYLERTQQEVQVPSGPAH